MKARILHVVPMVLALVVVVSGIAVAANVGRDTSASAPVVVETTAGGGSDDGTRSSTGEDRPPRTEVREEDGRREVRREVDHSGTQTYPAADAGTVTVTRDGNTLTIDAADPAGGWSHRIERATGIEVEVTFRRDGQQVDFKAEIEGQRVKVRVRERETNDPVAAAPGDDAVTTSPDDTGAASAATEDRPPRTEVREEDGRREVRREVDHSGTQTYPAADAGTVTVTRDGNTLTIDAADPAGGWRHGIERATGIEVEVTFRRDGQRVDFKAEIEGQWVKVRVRERED